MDALIIDDKVYFKYWSYLFKLAVLFLANSLIGSQSKICILYCIYTFLISICNFLLNFTLTNLLFFLHLLFLTPFSQLSLYLLLTFWINWSLYIFIWSYSNRWFYSLAALAPICYSTVALLIVLFFWQSFFKSYHTVLFFCNTDFLLWKDRVNEFKDFWTFYWFHQINFSILLGLLFVINWFYFNYFSFKQLLCWWPLILINY